MAQARPLVRNNRRRQPQPVRAGCRGGIASMMQTIRNIVFLFLAVALVGVLYKKAQEGGFGFDRNRSAPAAQHNNQAALNGPGYSDELVLRPDSRGHYYVTAEIRGVEVRFLVDTGASIVALTRQDAERIGLSPDSLEYTSAVQTANGVVRQAPVMLDQIRVAGFEVNNVQASVSRSAMGISLLGNSFLRRLNGYQVEDGNLILRW